MNQIAGILSQEERDRDTLFYMERVLELTEQECFALARRTFERHRRDFAVMLEPGPYEQLESRAMAGDRWSPEKEDEMFENLRNAHSFNEFKAVHDLGLEILLHHQHKAESCPTHWRCDEINQCLAEANAHYLEPDEVAVNTFVDAVIQFVVEQRRPRSPGKPNLEGNPGFHLKDALGRAYRCFVKQVRGVDQGDLLKLKITNIPGMSISNKGVSEPIVYLEPRVTPGDKIEVELLNLSHTGNSFTFRHHSYDGFLWFKRRGVNKELFNRHTLKPKDRIMAKILYTSEEIKVSDRGNVTRLGVIKAIPVKRAEDSNRREEGPNNNAAKALN